MPKNRSSTNVTFANVVLKPIAAISSSPSIRAKVSYTMPPVAEHQNLPAAPYDNQTVPHEVIGRAQERDAQARRLPATAPAESALNILSAPRPQGEQTSL